MSEGRIKRGCHYCRATEETTLKKAVKAIRGCNNCRADIQMGGEWTGHGIAALRTLADTYGREAVIEAWDGVAREDQA